MNLLFDQNISFRIVRLLEKVYPGCKHVKEVGLQNLTDSEIWEFAKNNDFTIVTFDADFYDFAVIKGIPPKIIWFRTGNTSTLNISRLLIENRNQIEGFCNQENANICLEIR
jgi:predicted nuclease of predicted toxin-antitoxin system